MLCCISFILGGTLLTVSGSGFGDGVTVTVDGNECKIKTVAYNDIICVTPLGVSNQPIFNIFSVKEFG